MARKPDNPRPDSAREPAGAASGDPGRNPAPEFPVEPVAFDRERPEAFLAAIVESSQDAIVGKTLDGVIRSWNPGAQRLFGYSAEEAVGRSVTMIIPDDRRHEEAEILSRLRSGERLEQYETERVAKDGRRLFVSLSVSPIRDEDGTIIGASKIARDITERRSSERIALRNRRTLEAIIETAPVAITVLDREGLVQLWNPTAERLFGWTREEALGRLSPAVPEDRLAEFRQHLEASFAGRLLDGKETTRRTKRGEPVEVALWSSLLEGPEGNADRLVSIAVDISDRKRAEASLRESEERFRSLADNIAQFAWIAHADGWIFWYNQRWFDYTGTTPEEMEGWGWRRVHHPDHVDRVVAKYRDHCARGIPWEDTFPLRGADGEYRWFLSRAVPIYDPETGRITRWMGTNTDITERRRMEEALREADRRKDEFLATLAHELRNPLAPIRSGLELLRQRGDDPEVASRVFETLERQTEHLVRLVDDLLDVSRITRGKVELRPQAVELASAVGSAVETSRPLLDARGHHLEVELPDEDVVLRADPTRLAQVFANLLNNAARYTPDGGRVSVTARRRAVPGGRYEAEVRVKDSGEGIPEERLESIFDLFVQGPDGNGTPHSGLGIGLTLVRSLVELHEGSVEAHSEGPGKGSEFVVHLPALPPGARPEDASGADGPVLRRPSDLRVVVADDNRDAADSLKELLETLGHRSWASYDGLEALEAVRLHDPHVVLLDLGMPNLDGYQAARRLRGLPGGDRRVLIALTGWGQDADRERTRDAGFDHHLVKPADLAALRRLLEEAAEELR